jgi:hypothetical protein
VRVPLNQGAYTARSIIASAQRAVNIYPEPNPDDAECKYTHYGAPGLTLLNGTLNVPARCLYLANNGTLYYCAGNALFSVSAPPAWTITLIGTILTTSGIVSMADNGTTLLLVDGSSSGYQLDLATNAFSFVNAVTNAPPVESGDVFGFFGADRVDIIDGFMVLNQPNSQNFYCTQLNNVIFDALNFSAKNGYSDLLVTIIVTRREIWLIGQRTTEIWFDAGGALFPFQILPGPFIQHGCIAKFSVAQVNGVVYWLSQDQAGTNILVRGEGYDAKRISTHALEQEWSKYPTIADAEAFCFQIGGHSFYQINFPTANKSWRWDEATQLWHEPVFTDADGNENRHRAACAAFAYGVNVMADWETGALYACDPTVHTDNGMPMYFRRGFPHMMQDGRQVIYPGFTLDVEAATSPDTIDQPGPFELLSVGSAYGSEDVMTSGAGFGLLSGLAPVNTSPQVFLRWSDDRGRTFSNPIPQSLGATGQYLSQPRWRRLGRARDRVWEVYGVIPGRLAINGAFLDPEPIVLKN